MEDLEGFWWLPSSARHHVPGTLRFSPDGLIELQLLGTLSPRQDELASQLGQSTPIILGSVRNGRIATLAECRMMSLSAGPTLPKRAIIQAFHPSLVYLGQHFYTPEEIRFTSMVLQFSHLPEFVGETGFRRLETIEASGERGRFVVAYSPPTPIHADLPAGRVSITYAYQTDYSAPLFESLKPPRQEVNIRQIVSMEIEVPEPLVLDEWLTQYVNPLRSLLSLATSRPNFLRYIGAASKQQGDRQASTPADGDRVQILSPEYLRNADRRDSSPFWKPLFTAKDIADEFDSIVARWLRVAQELDSVCNLFFGVQQADTYPQFQFLMLVQAAESYHRRRMRNHVLPEEDHAKRVTAILEAVPRDYQGWLKYRLNHGNEPTLPDRLNDLLKQAGDVISPLVPDREAFKRQVVDTRNYYSHYDPSMRHKAAPDAQLGHLIHVMSLLVQACLLHELGMTTAKIAEFFQRTYQFERIAKEAHSRPHKG